MDLSRLFTLSLLLLLLLTPPQVNACYSAIFSFGDSIADTGNLVQIVGRDGIRVGRFPYGETFFHYPTGRFCDGRLIVDFIAEAMALPLLPAYLDEERRDEFKKGVNFAVAGATAMEIDFFTERGIKNPTTNNSLGIQIQWFKQLLPSLCASLSDCEDLLQSSLFLMGEIGGNDYNYPFLQGKTLEETQSFVPRVIGTISSAIKELIEMGARTLLVPGDFPIGCNSAYLTTFRRQQNDEYYSEIGCINWLNEFVRYHNAMLLQELHHLRQLHPEATIIYADYYGAAMDIFSNPHQYGFNSKPLSACCGGGGPYNYNASLQCGFSGSTLCTDPSSYVTWDGLHLTEAAYRAIAHGLLTGSFANPAIISTCSENMQYYAKAKVI